MPRFIPAGHQFWPDHADWQSMNQHQIIEAYERGFAGAWHDPEEKAKLGDKVRSMGMSFSFADIAHQYGYAGEAAGKLVIPFRYVEYVFPGCWPGAAQERGDCVSHSTKNATLMTFAGEIAIGKPDEVTGAIEVAPEIPAEGIKQGAFSPESVYWWRGYNGDGWSCPTGASMVMEHGILLRKNYSQLGVDLTTYSGSKAGLYGSRSPGSDIDTEEKLHAVRTVADANTIEEIADALLQAKGVSSCGGEGFSSVRDQNGVSRRSGRWSHAMAVIGADLRPSTVALYGCPLILLINSWGVWNSGPRTIRGTNINIPEGAFWARWNEVSGRDYHVLAGAKGWARTIINPFHLSIAA